MTDKESFIELIPSLTNEQIEEITTFFLSAEKEINDKRDEEAKEKSRILTSHLPEIKQAFIEAKKTIYKAKEAKEQDKGEETNEKLIEELNNI